MWLRWSKYYILKPPNLIDKSKKYKKGGNCDCVVANSTLKPPNLIDKSKKYKTGGNCDWDVANSTLKPNNLINKPKNIKRVEIVIALEQLLF